MPIADALHKQNTHTAFWLALLLYGMILLFMSNTMIYIAALASITALTCIAVANGLNIIFK